MTRLEKAALAHAAEWLRYAKSPQARRDLEQSKATRALADRKAGHSALCSLTKCHPTCSR